MATDTPAPLPSDWPVAFVEIVKDHAREYAVERCGEWAVASVLVERHVGAIARKVEGKLGDNEPDEVTDEWADRFEMHYGEWSAEVANALEFYASAVNDALRSA
jgi:hypothetical protein